MYKIYIIEDDRGIAEAVIESLKAWDMKAACTRNFRNIMSEFAEYSPQLVLIDISLPFFDGYHWCSEIRKISKVPIIFISSAADNMNIVMAMNMGADDFIAKPFDQSILMAKIQALLRRTYDFAKDTPIYEHRGAILNTGEAVFTYKDEQINLSKNEYRILYMLMKNKGRVVSRQKLMEALWETDNYVDENTLTVNVNRLRKKIEAAGLKGYIETKFGVGYIIV